MRKTILVTMLLVLVIASTAFTGCAKKQAATTPTTTNGLDGNVAQGINEVEQNQNLTDPQLDNDMANVQDSLNNW